MAIPTHQPRGLKWLAGLTGIAAVVSLRDVTAPSGNLLAAGFVLDGATFYFFVVASAVATATAALGIFLLRPWSFTAYYSLCSFWVGLSFANLILTTEETVASSYLATSGFTLATYRAVQAFGLLLTLLLWLWATRYSRLAESHPDAV